VLSDDLLELQRLDTTADQLANRRTRLPEREPAATTDGALRQARQRRQEIGRRGDELTSAIEVLERDGQALTTQRTRLEGQLRTVISPRQAEALMHELAVLKERRDALDDRELEHLEEQSGLDDELAGLTAQEPQLEAAAAAAGDALALAEAEIDDELATVGAARADVAARLGAVVLDQYERLRRRMDGVAVAKLDGKRCSGCHLDLSASELEQVRATAAGELTDCPQCGRLLVP
jgi:predicted  nucleic acid-binding Zn-ribbon protein